eukprot:CAMPEP_0195147028 /NCGR_PEP_ID=MMETSP0448-20130528/172656_1 /TAXON_ID=66468 /ORGANISM="Heterocapsa triquestra, Strain CCMP 448" /LENGTH=125 /DNA_ID=CAMNT_0040185597 /DNA_START=244 /DNA_END=619 /DNA_ORIENTATION=-
MRRPAAHVAAVALRVQHVRVEVQDPGRGEKEVQVFEGLREDEAVQLVGCPRRLPPDVRHAREAGRGLGLRDYRIEDLLAPVAVLVLLSQLVHVVEGLHCLGPQERVLPVLGDRLDLVWQLRADAD